MSYLSHLPLYHDTVFSICFDLRKFSKLTAALRVTWKLKTKRTEQFHRHLFFYRKLLQCAGYDAALCEMTARRDLIGTIIMIVKISKGPFYYRMNVWVSRKPFSVLTVFLCAIALVRRFRKCGAELRIVFFAVTVDAFHLPSCVPQPRVAFPGALFGKR